jgi:hypothetical protein
MEILHSAMADVLKVFPPVKELMGSPLQRCDALAARWHRTFFLKLEAHSCEAWSAIEFGAEGWSKFCSRCISVGILPAESGIPLSGARLQELPALRIVFTPSFVHPSTSFQPPRSLLEALTFHLQGFLSTFTTLPLSERT